MNNLFAMVTMKSSNHYTDFALKSFFSQTKLDKTDNFLLIDNDGNSTDKFSIYKNMRIIKNKKKLSFAENVNQSIKIAIENKKNIVFLNNDIIFTKKWFEPLEPLSNCISIPVNNQLFKYQTSCGSLVLKPVMQIQDFNDNYNLLNELVEIHKKKYNPNQNFQTPLMPFFCFKAPYKILNDIGFFDESFGLGGGEDIDYRIRCAIKGYEVNFVLDSYLLHFHGKSTWDGNETLSETEERNKIYTEVFLKKWGIKLTKIFLTRKDFLDILNEYKIDDLFKKGKFGDLIRKII
tara:strand:- start:119 stop:991 length:873 start_codon:yes stop_codon:yes gene_type:complete